MGNICTLSCLRRDQRARVTDIAVSGSMRRRLQDIGLVRGTEVECVARGIFNDPAAYLVRGTLIAVRSEEADLIEVETQ